MTPIVRFLALPTLVPLLFFAVAATPVDLLGCRNRGLVAVSIALAGAMGSLGAAVMGLRGRIRQDPNSWRWVVSALVLAVPAVAVLFMA